MMLDSKTVTLQDGSVLRIDIHNMVSDSSLKKIKWLAGNTSLTWANPLGSVWFFAFRERKLCGVVCAVLKGKKARFKSAAVCPNHRNMGIYRALMAARIDFCISKGITLVDAFCNANSLPLHVKVGFKAVKKIDRGNRFTTYCQLSLPNVMR